MMKKISQKRLLYLSLIFNVVLAFTLIYQFVFPFTNSQAPSAVTRELKFENQIKFFSHYIDLAYNFTSDNYVQKQVSALVFLQDELKQLKALDIEASQENIFIKNAKQQARLLKIIEVANQEYLLFILSEITENGKVTQVYWQVRAKLKQIVQNLSNPFGLTIKTWDRQVKPSHAERSLFFHPQKLSEVEFPCSVVKIENMKLLEQASMRLQENNKKLRVVPTSAEPFTLNIFCEDQKFELKFQPHEQEHVLYYLHPETKSKTLLMKKSVAKKKAILTRDQIRKMLKEQVGLEVDLEEKTQK